MGMALMLRIEGSQRDEVNHGTNVTLSLECFAYSHLSYDFEYLFGKSVVEYIHKPVEPSFLKKKAL
jgi:hypothetical protein